MKVIEKKINRPKLLISIASKVIAVLFISYIAFSLVGQQFRIKSKRAELKLLNEKLSIQQIKNDELRRISDITNEANVEYIESIARESLGLSKQGEKVFVNVAGN